MPWSQTVMYVTKWCIRYSEYLYSSCWLYMYKVCQRIWKIYTAEINWSSLLIYDDLNYYYNVIYQPLLFAHTHSRYHAFKSEFRTDSHCKTAQFRSRYMSIIQMVLTLIRATLHCMSALSVCLFPIVHCTRSQQLRTICTCVTDYIHKFVWYTSHMQRTSCTKWV